MRNIWFFPQLLLWVRLSRTETIPAPIDIGTSQTWDGEDGKWSSFPLRVGTPAQNLRVLISTSATNTWVIHDPLGCQGFALPDCANARGNLFAANESTSFQDISGGSGFDLVSEDYLGLTAQGAAGFETVGLGFQGSGGPTVEHSVLLEINSQHFIVGRLGLNYRPTNFSSFNDPQISFLDKLYHDNVIPSLSYSYSAGAYYRKKPASLTLGGYNEGLFAPNDVSFPFFFDQQFDLTLGLQSITSQVQDTKTSLLPEGIMTFIDSTVTQIWLPVEACNLFEDTFGLNYDNKTSLYFLNGTQHAALAKQSPNITFTLGAGTTGGSTVDITFPYAAFDLNISYIYPTLMNSTYYFPLRRADNSTQYTLGRVFLQEAYLTVDNGRSTFKVSQRIWDNTQTRITPITSTVNTTTSGTPGPTSDASKNGDNKKGGISTGAIVAIVIVIIALLVIGAGLFLYFRLRKRKIAQREAMVAAAAATAASEEHDSHDKDKDPLSPQQNGVTELFSPPVKPPELQGDYFSGHEAPGSDVERRAEMQGSEAQRRAEMATEQEARRAEMDASTVYYELEAPHGMHEMSTLRGMRQDQRWGETTSPISTPISRKSVPSPISPQSPPKDG